MLTISRASAGAGKTFLLTKTYIDMLFAAHKAKNAHRRILAVTFTKKATAEMKQRIVLEMSVLATPRQESRVRNQESGVKSQDVSPFAAELKAKYGLNDTELQQQAQQILFDLLQDYSAFSVSTIDSFFQQVIRAFSRELGLSGRYNLELDTQAIRQTAVDDFFFQLSPQHDKATFDALLAIIEENLENNRTWNPKDDILSLSSELFRETVIQNKQTLFTFLQDTAAVEAYKQAQYRVVQPFFGAYEKAVGAVRNYMQSNGLTEKMFKRGALNGVKDTHSEMLKNLMDAPKTFCKFIEEEHKTIAAKDSPQAAAHEASLRALCQPIYALLNVDEAQKRAIITAHTILEQYPILTLLGKVAACIDDKNKELNRLPISDTNALLNDVVRANAASPFIYEKIGTRLRHFLIDEFQDTSTMQWTSFRPLIQESLATDQANLVVGDVKQSIYRFRNSDYSLMLNEIKKDFPHAFPNNLAGNWRSCANVVEANNALFKQLAVVLNREVNEVLQKAYPNLEDEIQKVYNKHHQTPMLAAQKPDAGYVQLQFTPCAGRSDKAWRESVLAELPTLIADLQKRNIPLGRVACLVRNNKEALPIAETLIGAGYKVMSNEGLRLTASPAVQFVILTLKHRLYPEDAIITFEWEHFAKGRRIKDTEHGTQNTGLFAQVREIIEAYGLMEDAAAVPYLLALQDKVYEYINKYQADTYAFLTWWDERAEKFTLSMQETEDAIQLVSIHKSKGLEYDVVIIPFCNWAKATDTNSYRNILWVSTPDASTATPPILPIRFSSALPYTPFAAAYYKELLNLYLDNLNLTYVAFTRAKNELYIFAPAQKEGKTPTNIGTQLHAILQADPCGMLLTEETEKSTYTRGEKATYARNDTQQADTPYIASADNYKLSIINYKLTLPSRNFFPHEDDTQVIGTLMHQILQQVTQQGDEEKVIQEMLRAGILQTAQMPIVREQMQHFWQLIKSEQKQEWYNSDRFTVLNEQDILLTDGKIRRPDRILLQNDRKHAIVIDYKFGHEHASYFEQIRDYTTLLQQMGYTTEGYLCYVPLGKIVSVE